MTSRRHFIGMGGGAVAFSAMGAPGIIGAMPVYPGWKPGELDMHFIQTGVGEQTFFIFPDTLYLIC